MKSMFVMLLALALAAGCSNTEPTALQGQGVVNPPPPLAPATEHVVDVAASPATLTPEQRLARAEKLRDSLPRIDANSPDQLIVTMQAWERVLRPEVMDAVRLGLTVMPIKFQERLLQATQATGRTPKLSDHELFRQTFSEVHGMRYDQFINHVAPLVEKYEMHLRNPAALTNPPNAAAGPSVPAPPGFR